MDKIEAVELLNTRFFTDTTQCREAWYLIRSELLRLENENKELCKHIDFLEGFEEED